MKEMLNKIENKLKDEKGSAKLTFIAILSISLSFILNFIDILIH